LTQEKFESTSEIESSYSAALSSFITGVKSFRPLIRTSTVTECANNAFAHSFSEVKWSAEKVNEQSDDELRKERLEFADQLLAESRAHRKQKPSLISLFFGGPQFSAELQAKKSTYLANHQRSIEREIRRTALLYASLIQLQHDCLDNPPQDLMTGFSCSWILSKCHHLEKEIVKLEASSIRYKEDVAEGTVTISSLENMERIGFCPYNKL
jgi:hypothetical protein